jgi:8-oxo-dGTP diphosphatase
MNENAKWEQPLISVDVVAVKLDKASRKLNIFVGQRQFEPNKGEFALPGVLLLPNERAMDAAQRALTAKVEIPSTAVVSLHDVGIVDNPDRDPRGPSLSVVVLAIIDNTYQTEVENVKLITPETLSAKELPFDHNSIITKALSSLDSLLMTNKEVTQALLGNVFSTTELHAAFSQLHALSGSTVSVPDLSNLSRSLKSNPWVSQSTISSTGKTKGRPASTWSF